MLEWTIRRDVHLPFQPLCQAPNPPRPAPTRLVDRTVASRARAGVVGEEFFDAEIPPSFQLGAEIGQTFRDFARVLDYSDLRRPSGGKQDDVLVQIHDDAHRGETWEEVKQGHGFCCHCSEIGDDLVNLEYWVLFGFNKPSIGAGVAKMPHKSMAHKSDLICVQMVYCRTQDRIVRVAFNIHGVGEQ